MIFVKGAPVGAPFVHFQDVPGFYGGHIAAVAKVTAFIKEKLSCQILYFCYNEKRVEKGGIFYVLSQMR